MNDKIISQTRYESIKQLFIANEIDMPDREIDYITYYYEVEKHMKCPVCKTECEGISCLNCGFEHLRTEFLNENEVDVWYKDFVFPFMVTEFFEDQVVYPVEISLAEYKRFQNFKIEQLEQNHYPLKLRDYNYFMRNNVKTIDDMLCFYFRKRCSLCNGRNLDTGRFYRTVVDILLNLGILYRNEADELSGM